MREEHPTCVERLNAEVGALLRLVAHYDPRPRYTFTNDPYDPRDTLGTMKIDRLGDLFLVKTVGTPRGLNGPWRQLLHIPTGGLTWYPLHDVQRMFVEVE